ncbi:MAG: outer membrane beta-barrel protein, partial [Nitrospiraceae bacterium]
MLPVARLAGRNLLAALITVLTVCPLQADTTEESGSILRELEHVALRAKAAEKAVEKRLLSESLRLHFYGYLDTSYTQNFNNPSNRINELRIFDVNSNQSRFNLAQFVLRRDAQAGGDWLDRMGFKVKFNAGRDSAFIGGNNIGPWTDFQEYYLQY